MRKRIIVVSPSSSTAPVVRNGSCSDHWLPASGTPTIGSAAVVPGLGREHALDRHQRQQREVRALGEEAHRRLVEADADRAGRHGAAARDQHRARVALRVQQCGSLPATILAPPVKRQAGRGLERAAGGERVVHRVEPLGERLARVDSRGSWPADWDSSPAFAVPAGASSAMAATAVAKRIRPVRRFMCV